MPIYKTKNKGFFKKWTPDMAYVLGFFAADGNMIKNNRGAYFIEFTNTDMVTLEKIRDALNSNHKISFKTRNGLKENTYRIQIGSKEMYNDLIKIGMTPNKSKTIKLPKIPKEYFCHFLRGYFDGDGCVSFGKYQKKDREKSSYIIDTNFTSGSYHMLQKIKNALHQLGIVKGGSLFYHQGYRLRYSINDSLKLYNFMYQGAGTLFLERKKKIFEKYFNK